jgi:hypothetical protein
MKPKPFKSATEDSQNDNFFRDLMEHPNPRTAIFQLVLSRIIETFAPHLYSALADFELQHFLVPTAAEGDRLLERILERFPRKFPQYEASLIDLAALSVDNAGFVASYLAHNAFLLLE